MKDYPRIHTDFFTLLRSLSYQRLMIASFSIRFRAPKSIKG
jgi:hypothetical protein